MFVLTLGVASTENLGRGLFEAVLALDGEAAVDLIELGEEVGHGVGVEHVGWTLFVLAGRNPEQEQAEEGER